MLSAPRPHKGAAPRLRALLRRVAHARIQLESHYHFTQDLRATPPREVTIPNIYTTTVDSPGHGSWPYVLAIAREQSLDESWCRDQLADGARCTLAIERSDDGTDRVVGMGMVRTQPFWIEEIRHHFAPGPGGCYLYALYVSPRYRGRGIQHAITATRLQAAVAQGCRYAYTLVLDTNHASLKGHSARGAHLTARIDCLRVGPLHLASVRKLRTSLPVGSFPYTGFPRDASVHFVTH